MWIDKPLCQHSEFKNICKWYRDGNCALNISEENKPPCAKPIEEVNNLLEAAVEELENCYGRETDLAIEIRNMLNILN